jgi:NADP-dependent 3-hydroxy acid dehydrogenase YdfG
MGLRYPFVGRANEETMPDPVRMDQAHALVIGASSEIGRAIAGESAALGMSVSLWGRDPDRLRAAAAACAEAGQPGFADPVDVTDDGEVRRAVAALARPGRDRDVKVSLISPGLVTAGAGAYSPAGQQRPHELLAPADVAAEVRFVVTFPARGCPTQIRLQPQRSPG